MSRQAEIRGLWQECFDDTPQWLEMFFTRVYRDEDLLTIDKDGRCVSMMLLQRYMMLFHDSEVGASYIYGACTRRSERGKGLMGQLIGTALAQSRRRGDMLCLLIPAEPHLYAYYSRKGFATVFFSREERYTALHTFNGDACFEEADDMLAPSVYEAYSRLEHTYPGRVLHSRRDFLNILDDLRVDGGVMTAVRDSVTGKVAGIGSAVNRDGIATVTDLMADTREASLAVMRYLKASFADLPFKIMRHAGDTDRRLSPRGMARIVNVERCLRAIAAAHPGLRGAYRVSDKLLPDNDHIFIVADNHVTVDDSYNGQLTLDVDIDVFTRAVFSPTPTGQLLGLPSHRACAANMLD